MRIYGTLKEIIEAWFKKDGYDVKVTPNSNTYVGTTTFTLPPKTSGSDVLTAEATSQTLTNKSMSGASNTFTNIPVSTAISGLGTGVATFLATPSSANLKTVVTDETGSGALVFGTGPTISGASVSTSDIDGGTASDTSRITAPKNTSANLAALTRKQGTLLYDTSLLKLLVDNGTTLDPVGSGSAGSSLNIVDNPSATDNTTGWTAATNYTVSRDTSNSPLAGVVDTCFAISTTTASSETWGAGSPSGVRALSLAMPTAFRNSTVTFQMYVAVPASSLGVWRLSIYNASGTRVSLSSDSSSVTTLPAGFTGNFYCTFDADSSASYTIALTQTTRTNANTLYATNISIGPAQIGAVAPGTSTALDSNITVTNMGTTSNVAFYSRRDVDRLIVQGSADAGTLPGTTMRINLAAGRTINSAALVTGTNKAQVGRWTRLRSGASAISSLDNEGPIFFDGSDTSNLYFAVSGSSFQMTKADVIASNERVLVEFDIPIAEWAGGGLSTGPGSEPEYASWNGTQTVYGTAGSAFPSITASAVDTVTTHTVTWQHPKQATDIIRLEVNATPGDEANWVDIGDSATDRNWTLSKFKMEATGGSSRFYGIGYRQGTATTTSVDFGNAGMRSGTSGTYGATGNNYDTTFRYRLAKYRNGQLPFAKATATASGLYKAGEAPGATSGVAIAAGNVGEMFGTLSSGTGGQTYKTTTTTAWTSSAASVVSRALDKGVYLVSAGGKLTGNAGGAGNAAFTVRIGGTAVTSTFQGQYTTSGEFAWATPMVPIVITADATTVAVYGSTSATSANNVNELFIVRIA